MKLTMIVASLFLGQFYSPEDQAKIKALWPKEVDFPERLEFYVSTKYAQTTAVRDYPQQGLQNVLTHEWTFVTAEQKYNVPGGLDKSPRTEWRSFPGVVRGQSISYSLETFRFQGAFGGFLRKKTWTYATGTTFVDLLVTPQGEPFMLRVREKQSNGTWEPGILYRDRSKFPVGFVDVKGRHCASCHESAGSASYGIGLKGSDSVFSFPFAEMGN